MCRVHNPFTQLQIVYKCSRVEVIGSFSLMHEGVDVEIFEVVMLEIGNSPCYNFTTS